MPRYDQRDHGQGWRFVGVDPVTRRGYLLAWKIHWLEIGLHAGPIPIQCSTHQLRLGGNASHSLEGRRKSERLT